MRVLVDIGHPGHVHLLKNVAKNLEKKGHKVYYSVRDIPVAKRLMDIYGMPYIDLGKKSDSIIGKAWTVIKQDILLFWYVISHRIDMGLSSGIALPHVSRVTHMKSFVFDDDDDDVEKFVVKYSHPYTNIVLSPSAVRDHRKTKNAIFYAGYHELAYLHPNVFQPDESVLDRLGIKKGEKYFVMRFVALKGHHDVGNKGLSFEQKKKLVEVLSQYGRVIITGERKLEPEFELYRMSVPAEDMHSVMYYASLYIGDSQTMTSEAAVLGVPALRCNTFVGRISYLEEEEHQYGLTYGFTPDHFDQLLSKLHEMLAKPNLKKEWADKRNKLLSEKINVSAFFTWFIENYPESKRVIEEDPDYQYNFK
jgi:predicted glycosyltransferase